jgi:hypothetical protein
MKMSDAEIVADAQKLMAEWGELTFSTRPLAEIAKSQFDNMVERANIMPELFRIASRAVTQASDATPPVSEAQGDREAALQDLAYFNGAKQYAAMAAQSEESARAWLLGGCGNRLSDATKALRLSTRMSGDVETAMACIRQHLEGHRKPVPELETALAALAPFEEKKL